MRFKTKTITLVIKVAIIITLPHHSICMPKIIRNNPLLNQMVSQFMNRLPEVDPAPKDKTEPITNIMDRMKDVLCSNFKHIPCDLIAKDNTLRQLLEKSVQQITLNARAYENTTETTKTRQTPSEPNSQEQRSNYANSRSEDLSNFLDLGEANHSQNQYNSDNVGFSKNNREYDEKIINTNSVRTFQAVRKGNEKKSRNQKMIFPENIKRDRKLYTKSGKKLKKYYPHKIKTKDKPHKQFITTAFDGTVNSEEKYSKSEEMPIKNVLVYKLDESPPWKVDYAKHKQLKTRSVLDKELQTKLTRTNPNAINDEFFENFEKKGVLRSPTLRIGTDLLHKMNHIIRYDSHE